MIPSRARIAAAALLILTPLSAAASLAQFSWSGKWGQGSIVYDMSVANSDPVASQAYFSHSIVSFDILGWYLMTPEYFHGTGGSIATRTMATNPLCTPSPFDTCKEPELLFLLGAARAGDPAHYQVNIFAPLTLGTDGWPLLFDSTNNFGGSGWISNDLNNTTFITLDQTQWIANVPLTLATPEPGTWALLTLGACCALGAGRLRRRA